MKNAPGTKDTPWTNAIPVTLYRLNGGSLRANSCLQPFVDQADARTEQQDPGDGAQKDRDQNPDREQHIDGFFERNIRPHENPNQRNRDQKRDGYAGYREEQRVQQHLIGSRLQVNSGEVFQREGNGLAREAGAKTHEDHHQHRQPDQQQQERRETCGKYR